ncbi:MAG: hypothetical protein Roseis2KO_27080 [Roseivirga sp.]
MKDRVWTSVIIVALGILSVYLSGLKPDTEALSQNQVNMKSYISIFEIPATDLTRAVNFYQEILDIQIQKLEFPELQMGLFPIEEQAITGVIMKGTDYEPSAAGITIYLNGGNNLQVILDKVESSGGKVIVPKTPHADEVGFFALFMDTEGNKMGLHSPE